jgi:flagellar biosynthesis/type III secretory pathway chaperone
MFKFAVALLTGAALFGAPSQSQAQMPSLAGATPEVLSEAISKAVIDQRIDVLKAALGLTPDQAGHWPAVEEAIRGRLTARHQRLVRLAARLRETNEVNLIDVMNQRAAALSERGAALKKLADAWKPLYETLDANQKSRLRFLAAYALREMRDAAEARRMQLEDHAEWDDDEH